MKRNSVLAVVIISFLAITSITFAEDSIQLGDTKKDVLEVLGAPNQVSKYYSREIWRYRYSSITFKNNKVYEYSGGQNLRIAINPNGKYLNGIAESSADLGENYSYNGKRYSVKQEEDYYSVLVRLIQPISGIDARNVNKYRHHKVSDYYRNLYPFIAENGSYYGQISEYTARPKTVYVRGYFRKDGTYVRSHYRSRPRRR